MITPLFDRIEQGNVLSGAVFVLILIAVMLVFKAIIATTRWRGAPPGPPTLPFIGNLHQMPKRDLHLAYQEWGKQYGPIFSLKLGSQNVVVLTTGEAIRNVIDKKSGNYADRPKLYMQDIWEGSRVIMRGYDALWRVERKIYHQFLNINKAVRYIPYQDFETKQLLFDLLAKPAAFEDLISRATLSIASSMACGFRIPDTNSPVKQELLLNARAFFTMVNSSKLLDWYPQLRALVKALPSRIYPLAEKARQMYIREKTQFRTLYDQAIRSKGSLPSMSSDIKVAQESWKGTENGDLLTDHVGSFITGIAMQVGGDSTSNTLAGMVKAMMLFPEVQRQAQRELDAVVGTDRLPDIDHFSQLPYIRQLVKESLRWMPTGINGAIPHAALADDVVNGYTIPAGTTVVLAVWSANNDETLFPKPREFDPTRHDPDMSLFEAATVSDFRKRDNWTFGAGRRLCPGMHVAERQLFLATARLLWAFRFSKAKDQNGLEIEVDRDAVTQAIAARPMPFPCEIVPRSERHIKVIKAEWERARDLLDEKGNYSKSVIAPQ